MVCPFVYPHKSLYFMRHRTVSLLLLFAACQGKQTCPYKPAPVFSKDLPHVVQYNYEKKGQQSLESLLFDTNMLLEIEQNICTETRQAYRFSVQGNYSAFPDSMWFKEAVLQLNFLSKLSPEHAPLRSWAAILDQNRPEMRLGEPKDVETNTFVSVDRVIGAQESTLLLVFEQR